MIKKFFFQIMDGSTKTYLVSTLGSSAVSDNSGNHFDGLTPEIYKRLVINYQHHLCNQTVLSEPYPDDGKLYCNATFDGWSCWNYTLAGTRSYTTCPLFLQYSRAGALAFKDCNPDGTWWKHPDSKKPWSDYRPCSDTEEEEKSKTIIYVYLSGYAISIVMLTMALLIFCCCRQLKCARVTIHKNLFASFILTALLWILTYPLVALNTDALTENPVWCRVLHVLTNYVTVCNYAWMFCEGFYLHTLIVFAFSNTRKLLILCYVLGWVVPVIPTIIYAIVRTYRTDLNQRCWITEHLINWIISGPIAVSLLVSFMFLINILRILLSKLRAVNTAETHQTRRTVRAIFILIPLFGLQYILIPFRPADKNSQYAYNMISAILTSYQGVFVALLFCFLNGEVMKLMKKKWFQVRYNSNANESPRSVNATLLDSVNQSRRLSPYKQTQHSTTKEEVQQTKPVGYQNVSIKPPNDQGDIGEIYC